MKENNKKKALDLRTEFLAQIISDLENNTAPWRSGMNQMSRAINAATGKPYRGVNMLSLSYYNPLNQVDNRWMTYKQAQEKGYQVRRGEKGSTIFFYRQYDKNTKKDFNPKSIEHLSRDEKEKYLKNVSHIVTKTSVFNGSQIDGMPPLEKPKSIDINEFQKTLIENSEAPIEFINTGRNFYSPVNDTISIANIDLWESSEELTSTIMHEIMHSTGHEKRLARDFKNRFGTPGYAREELVAELGTVLALNENGFATDPSVFDNNKAYLKSWIRMLKDKPSLIIDIIKDAEKAFIYAQENVIAKELLENETIVEDAKGKYRLVNDEKIKHQDGVEHKTDEKGNQFWYKNGVLHRDGDLPAVEYSNGEREWYKDGKLHRDGDKPAIIKSYGTKEWYKYGMRHRENDLPARENVNGNKSWYITGKLHREGNKPAIDRKYGFKDYYKNGVLHRDGDLPARENEEGEKEWYKKGKLHREGDKPAFIDWKGDKHWYINGERYRAGDKPTIECANGDKQWWKNGKVHRDNDKPAIEKANGDKQWYIKGRLHRDNDLPAIEREDGGKEWYKYGRRHRENDLPAIEHPDGYKEYYKNGKQYEYNDQAKENNSLENEHAGKISGIDLPHLICSTNDGTPFYLSLNPHDVGHTIILGPTGAGKSTGVDSISPLENETIVEDAKGKYRLADEEKNKINSPSIVQQNAQMFLNSVKDKTAPFLGAESYGTNLVTIFPTAVKTMDAGRSFRGTNQLLMQIALNNMGSTDNAVISYEKAKEHGAGIVKGAKGINLTTYNTDTKKQTVYRYYPASSVYNGDRIPEHEQPKSNLTLRCSGSSVEEYLGVYLAATYSGAAFQATKDVVEAFRENLTKDLEASFNDNKHTRIFEIGNKASSVCQKTLDNIESQNTPKKKSDEMFMKSQHTPFNPVTGEVFVGSNEAKARRVMQVLKSTDPRFIDTADIKTLGLSLKTKAIIKEPELQINIEGKRRTFFNAIDIDGLPALAVNTASNKRENEVAL